MNARDIVFEAISKKAKQHSAAPTNKTEKVAVFPLLVAAGTCALRPVEDATCKAQPPARANTVLCAAGRCSLAALGASRYVLKQGR